jgi:hypothetical protein
MLNAPCLKLRDINRIRQSPQRLISKVRPARVTQQIDDVLPAVLFGSHDYHQPLPRPDVAVAQVSGRRRSFRRSLLRANYPESEPNQSSLIRQAPYVREPDVDQSVGSAHDLAARPAGGQPPPEP